MKFGLSNATLEKFHSVFSKYPEIEEVLIYGSRAKGNYREGSDIDITLKGKMLLTRSARKYGWT
jgi:predicted nucleotidyltransferase